MFLWFGTKREEPATQRERESEGKTEVRVPLMRPFEGSLIHFVVHLV